MANRPPYESPRVMARESARVSRPHAVARVIPSTLLSWQHAGLGRRFRSFPTLCMNGYRNVGSFADEKASADLYEQVYSIPDESDDECMLHEIRLTVGGQQELVLSWEDVLPVCKVLRDTLERVKERIDKFDRDEELSHA